MAEKRLLRKRYQVDVLIIGGGTAGCYAAKTIAASSPLSVIIAEKANIRRSGCLAAGVNALNAYITKGKTPQDYVDYAVKDANGIAREDLLFSIAERFNKIAEDLERMGLVILKDEDGNYVARGDRNIKINGENIKPILAEAAMTSGQVKVLNHVNMTELIVEDNRVYGAVGFSMTEEIAYDIRARAVLIATGGAAGLYKPNHPGFSRHKLWYPPFNTGAGYAMGALAGAEMTTFEMRFVALRCKDTIAPTGTIAQGVGARQINAKGEVYENRYGLSTSERIFGTVEENKAGCGPCFLRTKGLSAEQETSLYKAYLNMAPEQTLKWVASGRGPSDENVEIEGTEPYVVGGHTGSGFWVDEHRRTTLKGLFVAGDAAGGCPQKYVTGALAEGEIAAEEIVRELEAKTADGAGLSKQADTTPEANSTDNNNLFKQADATTGATPTDQSGPSTDATIRQYEAHLNNPKGSTQIEELEAAMQDIMDRYAGGISCDYGYHEAGLREADRRIAVLQTLSENLAAKNMHELLFIYELKERLVVCRVLIAHLLARKETRWHIFGENLDHPHVRKSEKRFVNSRMRNGKIDIYYREVS